VVSVTEKFDKDMKKVPAFIEKSDMVKEIIDKSINESKETILQY
jgi:hypothetical protein